MKSFLTIAFLIILVAVARPQPVVAIRNVTLIDMISTAPRSGMTVIVDDGRIVGIERSVKVSGGVTVIDGTGKFLIPGLWDMHVHALAPERAEPFFKLFIANGITGIRDMGTTADAFAMLGRLRSEIAAGKLVGPRIIAAGRIMDGARPTVPRNSIPFTGEAQARRQVRFLKRSGADFIKVYDGVSRAEYLAIVDEASKLGLALAGHVPSELTSFDASDAGQISFEHLGNILRTCSSLDANTIEERANAVIKSSGKPNDFTAIPARIAERTKIELATFDSNKCESLYAEFVKNGTRQVPTLSTKRPLSLLDDGGFTSDPRMKYIPATDVENWKPENNFFLKFRTPEFIVQKKKLYLKELELVRAMHKAGVMFLAGTDVPGAYTYPGFSLHDELELYVQNGFTPFEALQTATVGPAKFLGMEKTLGTIEKGKVADMVLLDGDPLRDISNTKRIAAVITNGRYYSRTTLDQMLSLVEDYARSH